MKYSLLILLFLSALLYAQELPVMNGTDRMIINYTYNSEFDSAEFLIKQELVKYPGVPKYYFLDLGSRVMKNEYLTKVYDGDNGRDYKKKLNKDLINYGEEIKQKFENSGLEMNPSNKFYLAAIYGYLGRFYGVDGSWMSAFSVGKDAKNMMEELIENYPGLYDAYMLPGMFYYYGDRMGGIIGLVASILGLEGDREKGFEYMNRAFEKGDYTYPSAALLLGEVYSSLEDYPFDSFIYFESFNENFPKNKHIINWLTKDYLEIEDCSSAFKNINEDTLGLIVPYVVGLYYHKTGQHKEAIEIFEKLKSPKDLYWKFYFSQVRFMLMLDNWLSGSKKITELDYSDMGSWYIDRFKELLAFETTAREVHRFRILVNNNIKHDDIEQSLKYPPAFGSSGYLQGMYLYYAGIYKYNQKDYTKAAQYFIRCKSADPDNFARQSLMFLMRICDVTKVDKEMVRGIIDELDDRDFEGLRHRAKDLERKYGL